jgi:hypothetical protein
MDGLVSTRNQVPITILKRNFAIVKKFPNNFIHIFFPAVDKEGVFLKSVLLIFKRLCWKLQQKKLLLNFTGTLKALSALALQHIHF